MTVGDDRSHLAGPMLANGHLDEAIRVVRWDVDSGISARCACGRDFRVYGFKMKCRECSDRCEHRYRIAGYKVSSNGRKSPAAVCNSCGSLLNSRSGTPLGNYCFKDNRVDRQVIGCERCGSVEGVERHHWAPSAIFGYVEAERWPKGYLCTTCHSLWHRMMRKAGGWRLPEEERIEDVPSYLLEDY